VYLIGLGLGYIPGVYPHDSLALPVDIQHDAVRVLFVLVKNDHQYLHHKVHGGVMIIEEDHPVFLRLLEAALCFGSELCVVPLIPRHGFRIPKKRRKYKLRAGYEDGGLKEEAGW
jgi:hypothetical protein